MNSKEGPEWHLWEQPDSYVSRGLPAFRAAEAARRQGEEAFLRFHFALLRARHEEKKDIADRSVLVDVAKGAGLDLDRFQRDLSDRALLRKLKEDHTTAVEKFGVFGTPTLVFEGGAAAFLKMMPSYKGQEAVQAFESLRQMVVQRSYIAEVKRPTPPQSGG